MASSITLAAPVDQRRELEDERYRALRRLWKLTTLDRLRACQHHGVLPGGITAYVTPTPNGPVAGFKGLATCGSVWSCPVCSHKIAQRRANELADGIRRWTDDGGRVALVTLTMRHRGRDAASHDLGLLWDSLSKAWQSVLMGDWSQDQERYGSPVTRVITHGRRKGEKVTENRIGWCRAVEGTHGANGWHMHVHAMLFLRPDSDGQDPDLDGLAKSMFQRWRTRLVGLGLDAPIANRGSLDAKWITADDTTGVDETVLGGYFTKNTYDGALRAAMEATRGQHKKGRAGGRTPFQLLASVVHHLDDADDVLAQRRAEKDLGLWYQWETESKGRRQLTWARGWRDLLGLNDELTDEEIAAEDLTTADTTSLHIMSSDDWITVRRDIPAFKRQMIDYYLDHLAPLFQADPTAHDRWEASFEQFRSSEDRIASFSTKVERRTRLN